MKLLSLRDQFLEKELRKLGVSVKGFSFNKDPKNINKFIAIARDFKPDFFWFWKDAQITPKILQDIKRVSPKTKCLMWYGDQRGYTIPLEISQRVGLLAGLLITNDDPTQIQMYKRAINSQHVYTFYHSFSTQEFQLFNLPIKHDVFFGGINYRSGTGFPLSSLRKTFIDLVNKSFNLEVRGRGWDFQTYHWLSRPDYAKILRTAKINLGINHYDVNRYYNRRLFECVASGRLHITYYIPGMEKHFKNGKHLIWWKNIDEGLRLIRYYLDHPAKREEIAKNGRDFFIKNHSWPIRAKQFLNILKVMS